MQCRSRFGRRQCSAGLDLEVVNAGLDLDVVNAAEYNFSILLVAQIACLDLDLVGFADSAGEKVIMRRQSMESRS